MDKFFEYDVNLISQFVKKDLSKWRVYNEKIRKNTGYFFIIFLETIISTNNSL